MQEFDIQQCVELAQELVLRRREKARKKKSRKDTPRSLKQYQRRFPTDVVAVLLGALDKSKLALGIKKRVAVISQEKRNTVHQVAAHILSRELRDECRGIGRPRNEKGLIVSVMPAASRARGRKPTVSADAERAWMHSLWGVALGLWANEADISRSASIDDVITALREEEEWRTEIEKFLPNALQLLAMDGTNPPAKNHKALSKRENRARKKHPLPRRLARDT